MIDLSALLPDEDLRRRFGTPTLDRAWDYVRRGMVLSCTHGLDSEGDLEISGSVSGSTSAPYAVQVYAIIKLTTRYPRQNLKVIQI